MKMFDEELCVNATTFKTEASAAILNNNDEHNKNKRDENKNRSDDIKRLSIEQFSLLLWNFGLLFRGIVIESEG